MTVRCDSVTMRAGAPFSLHTADMSVRVLTVVIVSICVLAGCSGGEGEVLQGENSIVLVGADGDGDNMAGIGVAGSVAMVGDCLGIDEATVIWPNGTKITSEDPVTIDVPGLGQVTVGDHVDGGGDEYVDYLPKGIDAIPKGCSTEQVVAFYPNQ